MVSRVTFQYDSESVRNFQHSKNYAARTVVSVRVSHSGIVAQSTRNKSQRAEPSHLSQLTTEIEKKKKKKKRNTIRKTRFEVVEHNQKFVIWLG